MARRSLPGADKYRRPDAEDPRWRDPLVEMANAEVRIEAVLNDHFAMGVPFDAEGWKVRCPFAAEHEDGGIDRQFRVYASTNTGYCFALHGVLTPVRLWRLRAWFPSVRDAAEDLLRSYGVEYKQRPYRERMHSLREPTGFRADPDAVAQAVQVFLAAQPTYAARRYDDVLLRVVNLTLSDVDGLCERAETLGEVETWWHEARQRLRTLLTDSTGDKS